MKRLLIEYQVFLSRVEEIRNFLTQITKNSHVERIQDVFKDEDKEIAEYAIFLKALTSSKLVYNAIIISLYGCFENYFDKLLSVYIEILTENKKTYDDLPKKFKDKYRAKFGDFLTNPQRFSGLELDLTNEITNYHKLLQSDLSGTVNKYFVLSHSGNLRVNEIFSLMRDLGIDNAKDLVLDLPIFKSYYIKNGMDDIEYNAKRARKTDEFFYPIECLIEQRNSVAHSWNVDDRITLREINDVIVPFIIMFCDCVYRVCVLDAFSLNLNCETFKNEEPLKVFRNHIVCMNNQNHKISRGDYILYSSDDNMKIARIEKIQKEGKDILFVSDEQSDDIGLQLDTTIKQSDKLKMVINSI